MAPAGGPPDLVVSAITKQEMLTTGGDTVTSYTIALGVPVTPVPSGGPVPPPMQVMSFGVQDPTPYPIGAVFQLTPKAS